MCAILPLLLIIILQISLDQMNSFKLSGVNNLVYSYAEDAKQNGRFDYDSLRNDLETKLFIAPENIVCGSNTIIMSIMGMAYQSDLSNYYFLEQHLQSLTEECVAYAALSCYDEESGIIEFNESICQGKVDELISYASTHEN